MDPPHLQESEKILQLLNALNFNETYNIFTISDLAAQCYGVSVKSKAETIVLANDAKRADFLRDLSIYKKQ